MNTHQLLREAQFHGALRLADSKHRWYWAFSLIILLYASITIVKDTVRRYFEIPTYLAKMEISETFTSFPTVAICPEVEFPAHRIHSFFEQVIIPTGENVTYLKQIVQQLSAYFSPDALYSIADLEKLQHLLDYNRMAVETAGRILGASCEETLLKCQWKGEMVNCNSIFTLELTIYGYCCSFNGRSLIREIKESGFHKVKPVHKYLMRHYGRSNSLLVAVNQSQLPLNIDLSYKWLIVMGGQSYTEAYVNGTPLSPGTEERAQYSFRRLQLTDDVRGLSEELKRCRPEDVPLKYFPIYHKAYCLRECEIEHTIRECQCVLVVHPQPPGVAYCRPRNLQCARHAAVSYDSPYCNCPHTCDIDGDYVVNHNHKLINVSISHPIDNFYADLNIDKVTVVRVHVAERDRRSFSRRPLIHSYDLFAQLGGIFNVFFGCSVLTLLELIQLFWYYLRSLFTRQRPRKQNRMFKKNEKKGQRRNKRKKETGRKFGTSFRLDCL